MGGRATGELCCGPVIFHSWAGPRAAELFQPGNHGTTFGGTPLVCAAALVVLDVIEKEQLLAHVTKVSMAWHDALGRLKQDFPKHIVDVRGRGFLVGVQMTTDPAPYVTALRERGLLVVPSGGNVIRLLPLLVTTPEDLAKAGEIFRAVLQAKA